MPTFLKTFLVLVAYEAPPPDEERAPFFVAHSGPTSAGLTIEAYSHDEAAEDIVRGNLRSYHVREGDRFGLLELRAGGNLVIYKVERPTELRAVAE